MAYIIYHYKDEEVGRLKLEGPVLVGRSPECSVSIRDVLLSRVHCQIEPADEGGWALSDLGSKNGTRIAGNVITRHVLQEGDVVRMGKSTLRFFQGAFVPATAKPKPASQRPADPFEALSGTVSAFEFQPRGPIRKTDKLPTPKPGPQEPASFESKEVRGLVTELVSSSWDSIYEEAKRGQAEAPQSPLIDAVRRRRARDPHVDLALQVRHDQEKLSPEKSAPLPGVLEAPKKPGRLRAFFRRLGMLF
ncbi:MAG TPA: FHA domain-containing protein [Tepidisphaeraceae bacterium]|jgi:pSer/pThr/pTyr-binding forkhead associated (FHA) protein|nr:FHA domain-containing protein [Tepidisphaeraceae bacterium]